MNASGLPYRLAVRRVQIGTERLEFLTIANLDSEVDRICAELEARGAGPEEQARALDLCPYFGVLWPAARGLAEWLAERHHALGGRRVLEVGCGLALPSFLAARAGAYVLATDFHPEVPIFLEENQARNSTRFEYRAVDWRKEPADLGEFDHVVASEVFYDRVQSRDLPGRLARHVRPGGEIVIADPGRVLFSAALEAFARHGFSGIEERRTIPPSEADLAIDPSASREIRIAAFSRRGP